MPCRTVKTLHGYAIVCGPRQKPQPCRECGKPSTKLCDYPVGSGTCDAPLCGRCAVSVGPDEDHCPHHQMQPAQRSLL